MGEVTLNFSFCLGVLQRWIAEDTKYRSPCLQMQITQRNFSSFIKLRFSSFLFVLFDSLSEKAEFCNPRVIFCWFSSSSFWSRSLGPSKEQTFENTSWDDPIPPNPISMKMEGNSFLSKIQLIRKVAIVYKSTTWLNDLHPPRTFDSSSQSYASKRKG